MKSLRPGKGGSPVPRSIQACPCPPGTSGPVPSVPVPPFPVHGHPGFPRPAHGFPGLPGPVHSLPGFPRPAHGFPWTWRHWFHIPQIPGHGQAVREPPGTWMPGSWTAVVRQTHPWAGPDRCPAVPWLHRTQALLSWFRQVFPTSPSKPGPCAHRTPYGPGHLRFFLW